jgi:hypothetical protein
MFYMPLAENCTVNGFSIQAAVFCMCRDIASFHRSGPGFGQSKRNAEWLQAACYTATAKL